MKKYIKYYDENSKKMKRLAATENIAIDSDFFADRMVVRFVNVISGQTHLSVSINVMNKTLEDFCKKLQELGLHYIILLCYRKMWAKRYIDFLDSDRHIFDLNKEVLDMGYIYNLHLQISHDEVSKELNELSDNIDNLFKMK